MEPELDKVAVVVGLRRHGLMGRLATVRHVRVGFVATRPVGFPELAPAAGFRLPAGSGLQRCLLVRLGESEGIWGAWLWEYIRGRVEPIYKV